MSFLADSNLLEKCERFDFRNSIFNLFLFFISFELLESFFARRIEILLVQLIFLINTVLCFALFCFGLFCVLFTFVLFVCLFLFVCLLFFCLLVFSFKPRKV